MRRLLNIREAEGRTVAVLLTFVFFIQTVLSTGKVLQLSVFLDAYGEKSLALAFFLSAVIVMLVSAGYAALTRIIRPAVLIPAMLSVLALGFVLWRLLFGAIRRDFPLLLLDAPAGVEAPYGPFALYVWVEVASSIAIVQGWAYVNDAFDPRQAKRLIPLVGLGASVSFLCNGLVVQPLVTHVIDADELTWIVAGSFLLAMLTFFLSQRHGRLGIAAEAQRPPRSALTGGAGFLRGLREGFPQIARSSLLRLIVFITLATIVSQGLLDYLFMSALRERFSKNELAAFYASFIAILGVAQILLQLFVSGRTLVRFGGPIVVMIAPVMLILGGTVFLVLPIFGLLVALRFGDRLFKQAFYSPSVQALYTPVPSEEKRQAMTLIKGVLSPAAYGIFGLLMMAGGAHLSPRTLVAVLVAVALATTVALLLRSRAAYAVALKRTMRRLRTNRDVAPQDYADSLDWETIGAVQRLVFEERDDRQAVLGLQLVASSAAPQVRALINRACRRHPSPAVRREASRLIAERGWPVDASRILSLLDAEREPTVVRQHLLTVAALRAEQGAQAVAERLADPEPTIRAAAAVAALRLGLEAPARPVAEALGQGARAERLALAEALALGGDATQWRLLSPLLGDPERAVRAEALRATVTLDAVELLPDVLQRFLGQGPREEAGVALVAFGSKAVAPLGRTALDPEADLALRVHAIRLLGQLDEPRAGAALEQLLTSRNHLLRYAAGAALRALSRSASPAPRYPGPSRVTVLGRVFNEIRVAYLLRTLLAGLRDQGSPTQPPLLQRELELRLRACEDHVFRLLSLVDRHRTSALVLYNLREGSPKQRTHALELLELSFDRYETQVLVAFMQSDLDPVNIYRVMPDARERLARARRDPVGSLFAGRDRGLQRCAAFELPDRVAALAKEGAPRPEDVRAWLEPVLRLRQVPIFGALSALELRALCAPAAEVPLESGGAVFRTGAPADALFVVLRGEVRRRREGQDLDRLGPGDCLGESAVLEGQAYPCDADAEPGTTLLRIEGTALAEALPTNHRLVRGLLQHLSRGQVITDKHF